jgi:uncharacterized membrane protein YvbJ
MVRYCENCGAKIENGDSKFCPSCGHAIDSGIGSGKLTTENKLIIGVTAL